MLAAFLTRPDAVTFAIPVLAYVAREMAASSHSRILAGIVIGYVLIVAAHTSFRLLYYGPPPPNTFYLKLTGTPLAERISNGVTGLLRDWRREIALLSSLLLVAVGYQTWVGGDPWPYWRIPLPAMPAINVNKAIAIDALTTVKASVGGWAGMRRVPGHNKHDLRFALQTMLPTWAERFRWRRQDLTDWGREHYVRIEYQGLTLDFRKGAPEIGWSAVTARAK